MITYTNYNIIKKLVGPFAPVGETYEDEKRFENLMECAEILHSLIDDLIYVSRFSNRDEFSISKIGKAANDLLISVKESIDEEWSE